MSEKVNCEVVISGISGRFPNADNMSELFQNLYNKVDMVDDKETRWKHFNLNVPRRSGKIRNVDKFDANCFFFSQRQANSCDPQMRMLSEHCYEAIVDAGISPYTLSGTNTGVFVGSSSQDSKEAHVYHRQFTHGNLVSNNQFLLANGISFGFGFHGPSFVIDSACSSSGYALDTAFKYIKSGACDAALVCGTQLNLNIDITVGYLSTTNSALDPEGMSRPFDADANGFVRAETICAVFLQKSEDAKRVYASVLHTKTNNDGIKTEGMFYPSKISQKKLLAEFYDEVKIDPNTVSFLEAHATGTIAGDPQEAWAVDEVFCKKREKAFPIGTIKSNIGHAEAAAAMSSLAKVILTLENQILLPNINFKSARPEITALVEGRLRVVTENEPLEGNLVAMNSFGIIGANSHALLKGNEKQKVNMGIPADNLSRLLLWSGRTLDAVNHIFDDILKRPLDGEYVALLQSTQIKTFMAQICRGFAIFNHDEATGRAVCVKRDIQQSSGVKRPIAFIYSGVGSQWVGMGRDLMEIPIFSDSIKKLQEILTDKNVDLREILTSPDGTTFDDVTNTFVGIAAVQIGLTDVLKALSVAPDYIIGHSVGELGCAYADESLSAEETILAAHARGLACKQAKIIEGGMAAVGMELEELKQMIPDDIDIACHNSSNLYTISGPVGSVDEFVEKLSAQKIFVRSVKSNLPFHSRYIVSTGPLLYEKLKEIIKEPKKRSEKWLSSSVPSVEWESEENQLSSASYHTNNLLNPVLFAEACENLPPNALTIEISPHGILKAVLKRSMKDGVHISLTQKSHESGTLCLVEALGMLFQNGIDLQISKLYPPVDFPVSRGTPMISPNIKWDHSDSYFVPFYDPFLANDKRNILISLMDRKYDFLRGHMIDGKVLFPGMGYVFLAWETFSMMMGTNYLKTKIQIDDLKFLRATHLTDNSNVVFTVSITRGTNRFEVTEGATAIATGFIKLLGNNYQLSDPQPPSGDGTITLYEDDVKKIMRLKGYFYSGMFCALQEVRCDANYAKIKWNDNWMTFMDSIMQVDIMHVPNKDLVLPRGVRKIIIDPEMHQTFIDSAPPGECIIEARSCRNIKVARAGGFEISDVTGYTANKRRPNFEPVLKNYKFVQHFPTHPMNRTEMVQFCLQTMIENSSVTKVKVVEVDAGDGQKLREPICAEIFNASIEIPLLTIEPHFLTSKAIEIENVTVHNDSNISSFVDANLIVQFNVAEDFFSLIQSFKSLCFIICSFKEDSTGVDILPKDFHVIAKVQMQDENVYLIHHNPIESSDDTTTVVIEVPSNIDDFEWLQKLQEANEKELSVVLYSQTAEVSGILGLAKSLRKEPNGSKLFCVFIDDVKAPKFDLNLPFYKEHLKLGLAINIYKNGGWGTYRHMPMAVPAEDLFGTSHCYVESLARGDFSQLTWIKRLDYDRKPTASTVDIQYAALNFRDVMFASGRMEPFGLKKKLTQQAVLGLEFSGIVSETGQRVTGVKFTPGAISNSCKVKDAALFSIPDEWTLEEAATVPLVYATVYLAFFVSSDIRKGKSILIHAGSGGVGLAAIQVALSYGLKVYTTVSTEEKRNYLLETFPKINPDDIGNSRDTSFEQMVLKNTEGLGVDFVLNSLAQDKLHASIRCVAENGTFLEIGKFDILNGTNISLEHFKKGITFKPVFLNLANMDNIMCHDLFHNDFKNGIIKPLKANVFKSNELEKAFRFLASGKHVGKILIQVKEVNDEPEEGESEPMPLIITPQINFNRHQVHIIVGGLGGFGLELAGWLIERGVKKLVLNSKRGLTSPYQSYRINHWKAFKNEVEVNTFDSTTTEGCELLINNATSFGEVCGIWNLACSLDDGMFVNQTEETFKKCLKPKAHATVNLSGISRKLCPKLKYFVAFSSVSCGFGNPGQTNYAMANSIIERVVERRHCEGLPAKVIQWGPIADVGLLFGSDKNVALKLSGLDFQTISSCLQVLDKLLLADDPVVLSMVVAGKENFDLGTKSVKEIILNILGIKDVNSVKPDALLGELGMDSLISVELSQILARDYDVRLSPDAIKFLKLSELEGIALKKSDLSAARDDLSLAKLFSKDFNEDATSDELIFSLDSANPSADISQTKVLIIPGIEGYVDAALKNLALKGRTYFLQLEKVYDGETLDEIVSAVEKDVKKLYEHEGNFFIVAHSFGSLVGLKLAEMLEADGKIGKLLLVDGSPELMTKQMKFLFPAESSDADIQKIIATGYAQKYVNNDAIIAEIARQKSFDLQIEKIIEVGIKKTSVSPEIVKSFINSVVKRMKIASKADQLKFSKLQQTPILLVKAKIEMIKDISSDYGLQQYSSVDLTVKTFDGDHLSIIQNPDLVQMIKSEMTSLQYFKASGEITRAISTITNKQMEKSL